MPTHANLLFGWKLDNPFQTMDKTSLPCPVTDKNLENLRDPLLIFDQLAQIQTKLLETRGFKHLSVEHLGSRYRYIKTGQVKEFAALRTMHFKDWENDGYPYFGIILAGPYSSHLVDWDGMGGEYSIIDHDLITEAIKLIQKELPVFQTARLFILPKFD